MPDITDLLVRWWKRMLTVIVLSVLAVGAIVFIQPRQYLSVTTAIPASAVSSDKSTVFSENIDGYYSSLGGPDDLDKIIGTSTLDTIYLGVTDRFNLFDHYKISGDLARIKASNRLKANTEVIKSAYGQLKIKVWDTDPKLAPQLSKAVFEQLQLLHTNLQNASNEATLKSLLTEQDKIAKAINPDTMTGVRYDNNGLKDRWQQYEKLAAEYKLMVDSKPPALLVVEEARVAADPDRPHRVRTVMASAVLAFLFSLFAALLLDKRKKQDA